LSTVSLIVASDAASNDATIGTCLGFSQIIPTNACSAILNVGDIASPAIVATPALDAFPNQYVVANGTECACFVGITCQVWNTSISDQIVSSKARCAHIRRSVSAVFAWKSALIDAFVVYNSHSWSTFGTVPSNTGFAVVRTSFAGDKAGKVVNGFKTVFAPIALVNFIEFAKRATCDTLDALLGSRMVNVTDLASVAQWISID
jgi:hypothetical protein